MIHLVSAVQDPVNPKDYLVSAVRDQVNPMIHLVSAVQDPVNPMDHLASAVQDPVNPMIHLVSAVQDLENPTGHLLTAVRDPLSHNHHLPGAVGIRRRMKTVIKRVVRQLMRTQGQFLSDVGGQSHVVFQNVATSNANVSVMVTMLMITMKRMLVPKTKA